MSKQQDAIDVMPRLLQMIESDLEKTVQNLKNAVAVGVVAKDQHKASRLAEFYNELETDLSLFKKMIKGWQS